MKSKNIFFIFAILILLIGGVYFGTQGFVIGELSEDIVYIPRFTRTECVPIAENVITTYDWADKQDQNGWVTLHCSNFDHNVYTNQCEFSFERVDQGFFDIKSDINKFYICPYKNGQTQPFSDIEKNCEKKDFSFRDSGLLSGISISRNQYIIAQSDAGLLGGAIVDDEITIKNKADWYGLRTVDSTNYLTKEESCDISRIISEGYDYLISEANEKAPSGFLPFRGVMQYVSEQSPAISKQVIFYKGQKVWTNGNQIVYPIETSKDGIQYVNILKIINAPEIICNPALSYCSDDGTEIINIDSTSPIGDGKTCNEIYGGFLDDYVPNPNNKDEICKIECVDGVPKRYDCKSIPICGENEILNSDYQCISQTRDDVFQTQESMINDWLIALSVGLGVIFAILLALVVKRKMGGKR